MWELKNINIPTNINTPALTLCSMEILGQLCFRRINKELKCQFILWNHPVIPMPLNEKKMLRNNRKICLWSFLRNYFTVYNRFLPSSTPQKLVLFLGCNTPSTCSDLTLAVKVLISILHDQAFLPKLEK